MCEKQGWVCGGSGTMHDAENLHQDLQMSPRGEWSDWVSHKTHKNYGGSPAQFLRSHWTLVIPGYPAPSEWPMEVGGAQVQCHAVAEPQLLPEILGMLGTQNYGPGTWLVQKPDLC